MLMWYTDLGRLLISLKWQVDMSIEFKNIELATCEIGRVNCFCITGKLKKKDFNAFTPIVESSIKTHGKINLLIELRDFHGWTVGAVWEDTLFGIHHFNHIDKMAFVGDQTWEKNLSIFAKIFTRANVKYFDERVADQAYDWVNMGGAGDIYIH